RLWSWLWRRPASAVAKPQARRGGQPSGRGATAAEPRSTRGGARVTRTRLETLSRPGIREGERYRSGPRPGSRRAVARRAGREPAEARRGRSIASDRTRTDPARRAAGGGGRFDVKQPSPLSVRDSAASFSPSASRSYNCDAIREFPGRGRRSEIMGKKLFVGNLSF